MRENPVRRCFEMYEKNLEADFRLRLSSDDMEFLKGLADERGQTVSALVRSIIGDYRRSLRAMEMMAKALEYAKKGELSNGDTTGIKHDFV